MKNILVSETLLTRLKLRAIHNGETIQAVTAAAIKKGLEDA